MSRAGGDPAPAAAGEALLTVTDLTVDYPVPGGHFRAVDSVSFTVPRGGTLAIVGESGCGKSTIAKTLVRLIVPTAGRVVFDGIDLGSLPERRLRPLRHRIQMIFQDPYGSLDPHLTAQQIVAEPIRLRRSASGSAARARADALLDRVGLPATARHRRPDEFSGGQRQRIGIARALAARPDLLVCDEATSALDVSVQAQVLSLLAELQREAGLTYVFISHHLGVVRAISQRVVVMSAGRVVESGDTDEVLSAPRDPYTARLRRSALDPALMRGRKPRDLVRAVGAVPPVPHEHAGPSEPSVSTAGRAAG